MRKIDLIVIHCSATEGGQEYSVEEINSWHVARGFRKIGYHFLVHLNGEIDGAYEGMRRIEEIGAHAKGYNLHSIGVCYTGGLKKKEPWDTRTVAQIHALRALVKALQSMFPNAEVVGHRDLSVDLNGDGVIQKSEWMKACPSFDVKTQL